MRGAGISIILILLLAVPLFSQSAGQCFPNAAPTYLRLSVDDTGTQATLNAYLYALNTTSTQRQAIPISGGLLFVSWADFPSGACYMVTGGDGTVNATFGPSPPNSNYPSGGQSITYTVTFCPFTANNSGLFAINPQWLANCARFRNTDGSAVTRLTNFQNQLSRCPASQANSVAGSSQTDLSPSYQPSTSFLTLRNNKPSTQSVAFCWGLAAVFGLLFSAMFVSGRNPLYFFDWGATRGLRMNRYSAYYMPMTQNVSVAPEAVLSAADRGLNMAFSGAGEVDKAQADVAKATQNLESAQKEFNKVNDDPKSTPSQKATAKFKLDAATVNLNGAKEKLAAAIQKYGATTTNQAMQRASQGGLVSGWVSGLPNKINPFTDSAGKSKSLFGIPLLGNVASTLFTGMVQGVTLSVPSMMMGRGKFGLKKAGTALGASLKHQARVMAEGQLIALAQAGAMAVAPLLFPSVHMPGSKEWKDAEKEVDDAKENLDQKWADAHPYVKPGYLNYNTPESNKKAETEYDDAKARYAIAQVKLKNIVDQYTQLQHVIEGGTPTSTGSSQGIIQNLLHPAFELLANQWFGSEQPPRLSAMHGWGGVLGMTLSSYLTSPLKYDPGAAQRMMQEQNAIYNNNLQRH